MLPAEGGTEIPGKSSYIERKSPPSPPVPRRTAHSPVCFNSSPGNYKLRTTKCGLLGELPGSCQDVPSSPHQQEVSALTELAARNRQIERRLLDCNPVLCSLQNKDLFLEVFLSGRHNHTAKGSLEFLLTCKGLRSSNNLVST
ncbi:unnamed protein product [Eretmochelys imbricata]